MEITLPKSYLSYSAIHLWIKDKEAFRDRYYRDIKQPDTPFTLFGREVHEKLENDDGLKYIPRYQMKEVKLETIVEGIPIIGYVDCIDSMRRFIDYKSSIRNPDGTSKWNIFEVQKLDQLPFYSLLIKNNYSNTPNHHPAKLIWLETQWKQKEHQVGSQVLLGDSDELELSNYFEVFDRVIEPWERDRIKEWIVKNAEEISEDYRAFNE